MRIITKTGDDGQTSLFYSGRVKKSCLKVEVLGALDELNSFLGLSKSLLKDRAVKRLIDRVQRDLFTIGSEIACGKTSLYKLKKRIEPKNIKSLESFAEKTEKKCKFKKCPFVLPGENTLSSTLDVARTVARRAERRIVALKNRGMLKNKYILIYLNRLSDLLYLLARSCETRGKRRKMRK